MFVTGSIGTKSQGPLLDARAAEVLKVLAKAFAMTSCSAGFVSLAGLALGGVSAKSEVLPCDVQSRRLDPGLHDRSRANDFNRNRCTPRIGEPSSHSSLWSRCNGRWAKPSKHVQEVSWQQTVTLKFLSTITLVVKPFSVPLRTDAGECLIQLRTHARDLAACNLESAAASRPP